MTPLQFVLLLEDKAEYFKTCGITVTIPKHEEMAQASPDIIGRLQAIQTVELDNMTNLAGERRIV